MTDILLSKCSVNISEEAVIECTVQVQLSYVASWDGKRKLPLSEEF